MPSSTSGFGSFMEGIQGGIKTRDQMDIAKQYKERLRQDNAQGAIDLQENYDLRRNEWVNKYGGTEDEFLAANPGLERYNASVKDPALIRFGKWLGQKVGLGGAPVVNEEQGAMEGVQQSAIPEQPQTQLWPPRKADGGVIDEKDKRNYASMDSMDIRGGYVPSSVRSAPRAERPLSDEPIYPRTRDMVDAYGKTADDLYERSQATEDPREYGDLLRQRIGNRLGQAGSVTAGFLRDTADYMMPDDLYEGIAGFVGGDGGGEQGVPTPQPETTASPIPEPETEAPGSPADEKAALDATAPAPARTDAQVADTAIDEGQRMALENLDFRTLSAQGITPNDLPQMSTQEWTAYRREMMDSLLAKGMSPKEALANVDDVTIGVQTRGIQRYGSQAITLLEAGLVDEAAMAISMAFQYFPNGVSVQWANFEDPKTGRPALVARGFDEETGEPKGAPTLITAERLAGMVENMTNPSALRTWTKDHRDLQLEINELQSIDDYRQGSLEVARAGAITDRMKAHTDAARATGAGGMDYGDVDRRSEDYRKWASDKELLGEYEEGIAISLADAMDRVTRARPDIPPNTVIKAVEDAWDEGGELGVLELLESLRGE